MRRSWDRARVITVLGGLRDSGIGPGEIVRLAGVSRATAYRWMGGEVAPDYVPVRTLAWAIWEQHPEEARELVEASGWPWQDPPEPAPEPLVAPELAESLRRHAPEQAEAIIAELERLRGGGEPCGDQAAS